MDRLLGADPLDPAGPVRLNRALPHDRLAGCDMLANAREMLQLAVESDGLAATTAGNLSLAVVRELVGRFQLKPELREALDASARLRESDVWPIHLVRVLLELAGLLAKRKDRFMPTGKGRKLSRPESAGELFALLFGKHFSELNLAYRAGPEWPELQAQVYYTFYRLASMEPEWMTPEELVEEVVLAPVLERGPESRYSDLPAYTLDVQVLIPLVKFGLLEMREKEAGESGWSIPDRSFRATSLLGDFLEFEI